MKLLTLSKREHIFKSDMTSNKNIVKTATRDWEQQLNKRWKLTNKQTIDDDRAWDDLLLDKTQEPNYLQSSTWANTKAGSPWKASRIIIETSNQSTLPLQVFSRTVPGLGKVHYAPQVTGLTRAAISAITEVIKDQYSDGMVFKLEPYLPDNKDLIQDFSSKGWRIGNGVQYRDSVIVDLSGSQDELFARLKKRARWEVRVAQRGNVKVEKTDNNQDSRDLLAGLISQTGKRTGAFFRSATYLNNYWQLFHDAGQGDLYLARHGKDLLAGAYVIKFGNRAWYKDSGSVGHESKLMASRFLQWEIMKDLQKQGIKHYDLSGIPSEEELATSHMRGLYTFKTGFSDNTMKYMPAMEIPLNIRHKLWPKSEQHFLRLYSGIKKDFWY